MATTPKKTTKATIAGLTSAMIGRLRMLARAGFQFGTKRDVYQVAGYPPAGVKIPFETYWSYYERNEIAGRIVDMPAKTTWRTPPEIAEPEDATDTKFTKAFQKLAERMDLWQEFERADVLAGVGEYAVILLGVKGTDDTKLKTPLTRMMSVDDLIYLGVYHQQNATIEKWVTDPGDERFGLPLLYSINLSSGIDGFPKGKLQVHASRCIHVAENAVQDKVFGRPRLQRAMNRIFDLDKISASVGESYWQSVVRILQAEIDPNATITSDQLDDLETKMGEMVHDLRRQFMGQGTKLGWLGTDVNSPKDIADFYFALIAVACGIPRRILFGNELGSLASSTDQATYFGMINERQEHFAEPQLLRALIDKLIQMQALPKPSNPDGKYEVVWPTLFELTELEQADANLKRAQTAAILTPMGGSPLELVEIDEERNVWLVPKEPGNPMLVEPGVQLPPDANGNPQDGTQGGAAGTPGAPGTPGVGGGAPGAPGAPAANKFVWQEGDLVLEGGGAAPAGAPPVPAP